MGPDIADCRRIPGAVIHRRCRTLALGKSGFCLIKPVAHFVLNFYSQRPGAPHSMASILVAEIIP